MSTPLRSQRPGSPTAPAPAGRRRAPALAGALASIRRRQALPLRALLLSLPRSTRARPAAAATAPGRHQLAIFGDLATLAGHTTLPGCAAFAAIAMFAASALLAGLLAGCAPSAHATVTARVADPLGSLAEPVRSGEFDLAFWVQEQTARTPLWRQAFRFCRLHPALPNCRTVRIATWWAPAAPPATPPAAAAPLFPGATSAGPPLPGAAAAPPPPLPSAPQPQSGSGPAPVIRSSTGRRS
jgi:hypothetical protein